ncbi:hypothetical protein HUO09_16975 [Vibrio sp. Y2-5]|uniref:vWA domain-containing protein n=1 Tax=Vibrio sp. Y2-5 TaxID=2743977 RepID=UPI001660FF14|nr:vWA domain-containing protein [Vibrio sp. Y2-5]MBD0788049.1 hypothetical protein [Vibrio sp. Y2-5]
MRLIDSLPIKIGMYSEQFGAELKLEGSTACLKGKTIYMPYPIEGLEKLTLGFACQMSAMVREANTNSNSVIQGEVGIQLHKMIEQIRCDIAFMQSFRGVKHYFEAVAAAYVEYLDIKELNLVDYITVYLNGKVMGYEAFQPLLNEMVNIVRNDDENWFEQLNLLLDQAGTIPTYDDGVNLTLKIIEFVSNSIEQPSNQHAPSSQASENKAGKESDPNSGSDSSENVDDAQSKPNSENNSSESKDNQQGKSSSDSDSDDNTDDLDAMAKSYGKSSNNKDKLNGKSVPNGDSSDSEDEQEGNALSDGDSIDSEDEQEGNALSDGDSSDSEDETVTEGDQTDTEDSQSGNTSTSPSKNNGQAGVESQKSSYPDIKGLGESFLKNTKEFASSSEVVADLLSQDENQAQSANYMSSTIANVLSDKTVDLKSSYTGRGLRKLTSMKSGLMKNKLMALVNSMRKSKKQTLKRGRRVEGRKIIRLSQGRFDIFTKRNQSEFKPNSAVTVIIDSSGSIGSSMIDVKMAGYAVIDAFSSIKGVVTSAHNFGQNGSFRLKSYKQSAMQSAGNFEALSAGGGTPMLLALGAAVRDFATEWKRKRVLLVLTDGTPSDKEQCVQMIRELQREGVLCIGVGMGTSISTTSLVSMFGYDNVIMVPSFDDLVPKMMSLSRQIICNNI